MFEGLILGVISWISLLLSWWHLPEKIKTFTLKHPVLSDIVAGAFIYIMLSSISKSIVAAVGAIFGGLLTNITLALAFWGKYDRIKDGDTASRLDEQSGSP